VYIGILNNLDMVIKNKTISELFGDDETALTLLPNWNEPYMESYKEKILSGNYTFRKESYDNSVYMYFLCTQDQLSSSDFELAIPYPVE
jgi:hypothetical protein